MRSLAKTFLLPVCAVNRRLSFDFLSFVKLTSLVCILTSWKSIYNTWFGGPIWVGYTTCGKLVVAKGFISSFNQYCLTLCLSGGLLMKLLLGKIYSTKLFICLNNSTTFTQLLCTSFTVLVALICCSIQLLQKPYLVNIVFPFILDVVKWLAQSHPAR